MTRTYKGYLPMGAFDWRVVIVEPPTANRGLLPRNDVVNHSPGGFAWGHGGSGAAQLALAILCDAIGPGQARLLYQAFKRGRIEPLDQHQGWEMTLDSVLAWVEENDVPPEAA
jgi:hypothetical protein